MTAIPVSAPVPPTGALVSFIESHPRLVVLTGAGCSTASGIPDYRDADGAWKRSRPVMLADFLGDGPTRRRYWARSLIGWRRIERARPNAAHHALARLEADGYVQLLVTQNVDGLHQSAGSRNVIDLHGRIDRVRCTGCGLERSRRNLQAELDRRNPDFASLDAGAAPDGDADLDEIDCSGFDVPECDACGGVLKPDVVFFGERVPPERVDAAMAATRMADAMLVVGSSLMVFSGYRFVRSMAAAGKPIAAINLGRTRADDMLTLKVSGPCTDVLGALGPALRSSRTAPRAPGPDGAQLSE